MPDAHPPHPPLYFRVGVTGTRDQTAAEAARPAVAQILTLVKGEILGLARKEEAKVVYRHEGDNPVHPKFVFVSPLAEGADRVAAEEALRLGYQLRAPLPFAQAEYESDFPDTVHEFRRLLHHADSVLALDGDGDDRERSYEAVGRFVVNNSDLLIAVWDGEPARGRGGTGDIVELAVDLGVPVVHVPIDEMGELRLTETRLQLGDDTAEIEDMAVELVVGVGEPRLIESWLQLRRPDFRPYEHPLLLLIGRTILPSTAPDQGGSDPGLPALQTYWQEQVPDDERQRWFSGLYDRTVRRLTNFGDWLESNFGNWLEKSVTFGERETFDPPRPLAPPAHGSAEEWWTASYEPADELSNLYGDWYRSSYVLILYCAFIALSLAAIALSLAALALAFPKATIFSSLRIILVLFEFILILLIAGLWGCNSWLRWHRRWISYRLLAELCRKQKVLAPLGRSLPRWEIEHLPSEADIRDEAWVGWYFSAMARAAPFPCGDLRGGPLEHARKAGLAMVYDQIGYHVGRGRRGKADVALRVFSGLCFVLTAICVVSEFFCVAFDFFLEPLLGALAAILPTAAAFFFGIRAYAEFELLADQSARMYSIMCGAWKELEGMPLDRPLASQDLGARIFRAATLMMHDIHGWAQLFRVKHVETH